MAEHQLPKLNMRVRFPSSAPEKNPLLSVDKRGFFSTKSVLLDGIKPPAVDEITSVMKYDFVGRKGRI